MEFDPEVEQAIEENVPLAMRDMVRRGLEEFAREKGAGRVTMEILLEAREKYLGKQEQQP